MGLAHDLNNLLTGVCSMSELSLMEIPPNHPLRERLDIIRINGQKAAELVRKLFLEHQAAPGKREHHDLNALSTAYFALARQAIPKSIQTVLNLESDPLPVFVDEIAFRTVFLHLAINAAEAIDGRGNIEFRTALHSRLPRLPTYTGVKLRPPVASLQVSDTGRGLQPASFKKIGKPNFTTKPANAGAGLGLYLTKRFVEANGGGLSVQSKGGATFTVWLPIADFSEAPALKP
jgi:signal transduction histidine kinase